MSCVYIKNCPYAEIIETSNGETHCKKLGLCVVARIRKYRRKQV